MVYIYIVLCPLQVTGKFRGVQNPYDVGCARNCAAVLCSPKKPRYVHYKIKDYYPLRKRPTQSSQASPQRAQDNDLRCMPIYEDLDNNSTLQRERVSSKREYITVSLCRYMFTETLFLYMLMKRNETGV